MSAQSTTMTPSQHLAAERARRIVPDMMEAITTVKRNTTWIARLALAVTTPHQVLFIGGLAHGGTTFEIITAWLFAVLVPAVTDLGMLTMLKVTQTHGMARTAKRRALVVLLALVAESATVNALAPGHIIFRVLVAATALTLAAVEFVASAIDVDVDDVRAAETAAIAAAPAPAEIDAAEQARRDAKNAAARQRRADRKAAAAAAAADAAQKAADAAERRRLARQTAQLEKAFNAADAPTSPAPMSADTRAYM